MSFKAKNLRFEAPEAPFLKGLFDQHDDTDVPRQCVYGLQSSRPKRDGDDDGPLVIDEEGNEVSKEDMGKMEKGELSDAEAKQEKIVDSQKTQGKGSEKKTKKQESALIGSGKKRKVGKVVGGGGEQEEVDGKEKSAESHEKQVQEKKPANSAQKPAKKKQKKAIGLSFEDDDG